MLVIKINFYLGLGKEEESEIIFKYLKLKVKQQFKESTQRTANSVKQKKKFVLYASKKYLNDWLFLTNLTMFRIHVIFPSAVSRKKKESYA